MCFTGPSPDSHPVCLAGEVKDPKKAYTRGLGVALVFMALTYFVPLLFAVALDGTDYPWEQWCHSLGLGLGS